MSALTAAELALAGVLMRLRAASSPEEKARWAQAVEEATQKLEEFRNRPATPAATEPRCWCGAQLLQVGRRQVCALGSHDD